MDYHNFYPPILNVNTSHFNKDLSNFKEKDLDSIYVRKTIGKDGVTYKIATTEHPFIKAIYHFFVEKLSHNHVEYLTGKDALVAIKTNADLSDPLIRKHRLDLNKKIETVAIDALHTNGINLPAGAVKTKKEPDEKSYNFIVELLKKEHTIPDLKEPPFSLDANNPHDFEVIKQLATVRNESRYSRLEDLENYGFNLNNDDHRKVVKNIILNAKDSHFYVYLKNCNFFNTNKEFLKEILLEVANKSSWLGLFFHNLFPHKLDDFDKQAIEEIGIERAKNGINVSQEIEEYTSLLGKDSHAIQDMIAEQVHQGAQPIYILNLIRAGIPCNETFILKILKEALKDPDILPQDISSILRIPSYFKQPIMLEHNDVKVLLNEKYEFLEEKYEVDGRMFDNSNWVPKGQTDYFKGYMINDQNEKIPHYEDFPGSFPAGTRVMYVE